MRTRTTRINACDGDTTVGIKVNLKTEAILTQGEFIRQKRNLNNLLWDALRAYGFSHEEIKIK